MPLGTKVGLSSGDSVLDGDPAQSAQRGGVPSPTFGPFLLWPNAWMHQDATWYEGRPETRGHWVRWGPSPLSQKEGGGRGQSPPIFGRWLLWPNGWMDQDGTMALGMEVGLGPVHIVLDGDTAPLPKTGAEPQNFRPIFTVAKRLDASRCHLVRR